MNIFRITKQKIIILILILLCFILPAKTYTQVNKNKLCGIYIHTAKKDISYFFQRLFHMPLTFFTKNHGTNPILSLNKNGNAFSYVDLGDLKSWDKFSYSQKKDTIFFHREYGTDKYLFINNKLYHLDSTNKIWENYFYKKASRKKIKTLKKRYNDELKDLLNWEITGGQIKELERSNK